MKQQIDNLIAKILLTEGVVYLPNVGRLILYRHPAQLKSKRQLSAPYRELRLEKEEQGRAIALHIVDVANISEERASDIYTEWLSQSLRNEVLTIGGVCTIKGNEVTIDDAFEKAINSDTREPIALKPRKNETTRTALAAVACMLLGAAIYVLHDNGALDPILESLSRDYQVETISTATNEPTEEAVTAVEVASPQDTLIVATIEADSTATIAPVEAEPTETAATEMVIPSILPMTAGHSYAVWGVYSELKNAEEAKAWLGAKFPKLKAEIYQYDARYMVAIYESSSREACNNKIRGYKAQSKSFKNMWAYTR